MKTKIFCKKTLILLFFLLLFSAAHAENKSGVDPQVISLPDGPGSVQGLGESFTPNLNNGTAPYKVNIEVCPGVAGFQPQISFSYDGGNGNGIMGMGWNLDIPYIQRQTDKGLPEYTNADTFVYAGQGELVPLANSIFRLKLEGSFIRFILQNNIWEVQEKNGVRHFFGETASSRLSTGRGIFKWLPERSLDPNGNEIRYFYFSHENNLYLQEIRYAFTSALTYRSVSFTYEDRQDISDDYRSRSKVSIAKRLKQVSVLSENTLIRRYDLSYDSPTGTVLSRLMKITRFGKDGASALPSMSFAYSDDDPAEAQTVEMQNPPGVSLTSGDADLLDVDGDSLPDIFFTLSTDSHRFWINEGYGKWAAYPIQPASSPPSLRLSTKGVLMADLNGSGFSDLIVQTSFLFGFFRNTGKPWEKAADWVPYAVSPPFSLENTSTRMMDINNDGLTDAVYSGSMQITAYLNDSHSPWTRTVQAANPGILLSDKRIRLTDMNGDGMEDMLYLGAFGNIFYLPNMGYGQFGDPANPEVIMANSPTLPDSKVQDGSLMAMDVNGDGLSDLVQIDSGEITLWLNRGNRQYSAAYSISGTPDFTMGIPAFRAADMDGDGCRDILYARSGSFRYVSFNPGTRPNLMTFIDNGLGMETVIIYKNSTEYYLQARDQGNPWETKLPFPVQVVSQKTITDKISGDQYVVKYIYRNGYYDGEKREFRGFAQVDQVETGDLTAPTLKTFHVFDVGKEEESRKGMLVEQATLTENGSTDPVSGLYQHTQFVLKTRNLATGSNAETVRFSFTAQQDSYVYENTITPKHLRTDFDYDEYGNEIKNFSYGIVNGTDFSAGSDEILTANEYYYWTDSGKWMTDRVKRIRQTDLNGQFVSDTRQFYDERGNLIRLEKSPDNVRWIPIVRNEYDIYGNITKMTDANSHSRTIGWDTVFHTFPVSETIDGLNLSMTAGYDYGFGKITYFTDFNSHSTVFEYDDPHGRLTAIIKPGDSPTYPTQSFIYRLYDPSNSIPVSHIISKNRENAGQSNTYDTYSYYDGLGRKLQIRSEGEAGQWIVSEAAVFNQRMTEKQKWLPYFAGSPDFAHPDVSKAFAEIHYDPTGRIIKEINPDASFRTTAYLPLQKQVRDEEDNGTGIHANTPHLFTYDGLERLAQVTERNGAASYITQYQYDGLNNLTRITDDHSNVKTMTFDGLGRKIHMNDPDKGQMNYVYDDAGNLKQTTDNKNQTVTYSYDAANRILTEDHNGVKVRFFYDNALPADRMDLQNTKGRLAYVEDEAGRVAFSYNARGSLILKARKIGEQEFVMGMSYDSMDRMTRLVYPDGEEVQYAYNAMNQLENIPGYVENIDYQASGLKSRFVYASGAASDYAYDIRQRMKTLVTATPEKQLQNLTYVYDKVSNITAITDGHTQKTPESLNRQFSYDNLYRLTQCTAPSWQISYAYDSIGNLTQQNSNVTDARVNLGAFAYGEGSAGPHAVTKAGSFIYNYDGNGNIRTKTGYTYTFDHKDRMTAMNRTADGLNAVYQYDYEGNRVIKEVTKDGSTETTLYIDKAAEVRGNQMILHIYAGDRKVARISKPFDPAALLTKPEVLHFEDFDTNHDGTITLAEIKAKGADPQKPEPAEVRDALKIYQDSLVSNPLALNFGTMAAAVHGLNAEPVSGEIRKAFYIPDHLGSSSIMTDEYGNVVEESVYYPYGMNRTRAGEFEAEYRFTGKELDEESDLHYFGARYYDAMVGRFVSVDPLAIGISISNDNLFQRFIHNPVEMNLYHYASNNPIMNSDPDGKIWGAVIGAAVEFGTQVAEKMIEGKDFATAIKEVDYVDVAISAGVGLVTGGLSAATGAIGNTALRVGTEVVISAAGNVAEGYLQANFGTKTESYNINNATGDAVIGAATEGIGFIGYKIAQSTKGAKDLIFSSESLSVSETLTDKFYSIDIQYEKISCYSINTEYGKGHYADAIKETGSRVYSKIIKKDDKKE